jgi:peroxiredoxin
MIGAWNFARGGALQVGDLAPDFTLQSADRRASVHLSSFRGKQPVLLVFGSYT